MFARSAGRRAVFLSLGWALTVSSAWAQDAQEPHPELPGLEPTELPQFVAFTFDDNWIVERIEWANTLFSPLNNPAGNGIANNYDGTPARTTFFSNGVYLDQDGVPEAWRASFDDGHEIANHTDGHPNGRESSFDQAAWASEMTTCSSKMTDPVSGVGPTVIRGFRTPYLGYNAATYAALDQLGFEYDSTLGSCWPSSQDGSNCLFPYTLDDGSPDAQALNAGWGEPLVASHPGLWEVPVSTLMVPPDSLAATYSFTPGLRGRIPTDMPDPSHYEPATGKLAGLDYTAFVDAGMTGPEFLATLKYTFDLRYDGNRAPMVIVGHTHVFSDAARRQALADFLAYVLAKPATRVRPVHDIVEWMRHPTSLTGQAPRPVVDGTGGSSASGGTSGSGGSDGALGGAGGDSSEPDGGLADPGCGCAVGPTSRTNPILLAGLSLGLVALTRLRRRTAG
ncbi:MAG TPA: polysaccharide deacetylase family protein [Polyangiaceae bacterium]|nr:polysaccharide deacetylase family protein [Polyangiaceae bacterium]